MTYESTHTDQVCSAFERMTKAAKRVGVVPTEGLLWVLEHGSPKNGRAWRVFWATTNGTLHQAGYINDYLGMGKREAVHTLRTLADAFEAVASARTEGSI